MVAPLPKPSDASPEAHIGHPSANSTTTVPIERQSKKKLDKQSVEYVLKSGLAGGLAGCAVSKL